MTNDQKNQPKTRAGALPFSQIASLLALLVPLVTAYLYFAGYSGHKTFLAQLGLDIEMFPKTTSYFVLHGLYVLCRFVIPALIKMYLYVLIAVALLVCLRVLPSPPFISRHAARYEDWKHRRTEIVRESVQLLGYAVALCLGPLLVLGLVVLPSTFGQDHGEARATKMLSCPCTPECEPDPASNRTPPPCVELRKDGSRLSYGAWIDTSGSRAALYDTDLKRVRVLELQGTELLVAVQPPPATDPGKRGASLGGTARPRP